VANAPYTYFDDDGDVVNQVPAVGGSILNSVGIELNGVPLLNSLGFDGHAVGPIAAWQGFSAAIAGLLNPDPNAWDVVWSGKGQPAPPPAEPPLSGGSLPLIPSDFFDDGGAPSGAAADAVGDFDFGDFLAALG